MSVYGHHTQTAERQQTQAGSAMHEKNGARARRARATVYFRKS